MVQSVSYEPLMAHSSRSSSSTDDSEGSITPSVSPSHGRNVNRSRNRADDDIFGDTIKLDDKLTLDLVHDQADACVLIDHSQSEITHTDDPNIWQNLAPTATLEHQSSWHTLTERLLLTNTNARGAKSASPRWTAPGSGNLIRLENNKSNRNFFSEKSVHRNRRKIDGTRHPAKWLGFLLEKRCLAILGAFLINLTLGTVYTLSNVNSYMTSYIRKHSDPTATYGGSLWFSSLLAVGQGFSMVFGGFIERRFSARLSCIIGCIIHSAAIASTRWAVDWGFVPTLITYGLLPGIGLGLAYLTPITNAFGWWPNRKGMVSGIILAGFGGATLIFNIFQTHFVNPNNLSPDNGAYFDQAEVLQRVPLLFTFLGCIYGTMQFIGCCLLFKPPPVPTFGLYDTKSNLDDTCEIPILEKEMSLRSAIRSREFWVLYFVYGITTQGVLLINSVAKEYGQLFIKDDMYLAAVGSLASVANCLGRLFWGIGVDHFEFGLLFTIITIIFGSLIFLFPFKFILSSKVLYLICTLGIFGSFSGWMAIYPVHCSRSFGVQNAGIMYGLIFTSQSIGGVFTAIIVKELMDNYNRFIPCICVFLLEAVGLVLFHLFYPRR
ncbi:yhjX [Fragariocoptes setiger]|uniref:YhjX n=1 Tax=Fragariocoptes setiger TaxID=1670756 RepID=A0ABQ7S7G6_9ACAR|nr:yhjX [Fragariocoptes setiger]